MSVEGRVSGIRVRVNFSSVLFDQLRLISPLCYLIS